MVRIINKNNIKYIMNSLYFLLNLQAKFTHIIGINQPTQTPCIYAMWHANNFAVHGFPNRENVNVLISTSLDGDIVASTCEKWGFKVQRGSTGRKGSVEATLRLIEKLKHGESAAIMVDGPHGPYHVVKRGVITLSKESDQYPWSYVF